MPCNTITRIEITDKAMAKWNEERAKEAVKIAGLSVSTVYFSEGKLFINSNYDTDQVKAAIVRQYSNLTVQAMAKRFGFKINQSVTKAGTIQLKLSK